MRRFAGAVLAVIMLLSAVPALAQVTQGDIARAREELREVSARLEGEAAKYEQAVQEEEALRAELDRLVVDLAVREQELAEAKEAARERVAEMYMNGIDPNDIVGVFDAESFAELPTMVGYLEQVADADRTVVNRLTAVRQTFLDQQEALDIAIEAQNEATAALEELAASIGEELAAADAEYRAVVAEWERQEEERRRREEEEERQRREAELAAIAATSTTTTTLPPTTTTTLAGDTTTTTVAGDDTTTTTLAEGEETTTTVAAEDTTTTTAPPPPPPAGTMVCPVAGATAFTDTWGAPRSGGRRHQGVDMVAARGTSLVAITSGTVLRLRNGGLGGISVWMTADNGDTYYYAHMDAWAAGLAAGQPLVAGTPLGTVGSTGNASYSAPHLHFEHHPGGGAAVNPYPLVKGLCG